MILMLRFQVLIHNFTYLNFNFKQSIIMKSTFFIISLFLSTFSICQAQMGGMKMPSKPTASTVQEPAQTAIDSTKTPEALLDKAVLANDKGDKAATVEALKSGTAALETEAKGNTGSLKDKLMGQVGNLKNLIPLAESGMLGSGILPKAAGIAKLLVAHQRIEGIIGGTSMLSNVGALTSNLQKCLVFLYPGKCIILFLQF